MKTWGNCLIFYEFQIAFDIIGETQMLGQWPNACKDVISWACDRERWVGEHEQVSMNKSFLEYYLTHGIEYYATWKNILPRVHGWMIFMDENENENENGWTFSRMLAKKISQKPKQKK
jgi:hypothetical protein